MSGAKITRVILADDHEKIRAGIREILKTINDIVIIGEARNGLEALKMVEDLCPDILLLDMEMPLMKGDEVAKRLRETGSPVHILVISAYEDRQYVLSILDSGASGYLTKEDVPEALIKALRGVTQGQKGWISQRLAEKFDLPSRITGSENLNFRWKDVEPEAKQYWDQRSPGAWDHIKSAVRYAWDEIHDSVQR